MRDSDVNPITLRIKDKALREEFEEQQLLCVQKRWNILTLVFIAAATFAGLTSINDSSAIVGFLLNTGDCALVGIVMSLLGLRWKQVHNYSLIVLVFVHGVTSCVLTHLLVQQISPLSDYIDYFTTN